MERLTILATFLLVTTLFSVPSWARTTMGSAKSREMEILDEMMKVKILREKIKVSPVVGREEMVVVEEEAPLKARLQGCAGVGENCVFVPCCETSSAGNRVFCSEGPYNAVCVELIPGPPYPWKLQKSE